jgi:hypothetical protein
MAHSDVDACTVQYLVANAHFLYPGYHLSSFHRWRWSTVDLMASSWRIRGQGPLDNEVLTKVF